jgi:hypothetical protein
MTGREFFVCSAAVDIFSPDERDGGLTFTGEGLNENRDDSGDRQSLRIDGVLTVDGVSQPGEVFDRLAPAVFE